jgi:hypothetical protein
MTFYTHHRHVAAPHYVCADVFIEQSENRMISCIIEKLPLRTFYTLLHLQMTQLTE